MDVSIIIPTYNERENIPELIDRIKKTLDDKGIKYEIIFVDDNSEDKTYEIIEEYSRIYNNIKLIKRKKRLGLNSAFIEGYKNSKGKYIVLMDADLQHPPELLYELYIKAREGYDIVVASRYIEGGEIEEWNLFRKLISKISILISHIFLPKTRKIKDVVSGYFLVKRELLKNFELTDKEGFKILLEIIVKTDWNKIVEIPYKFSKRKYGKSKLGIKEGIRYIYQIFNLSILSRLTKFSIVGFSGTLINLIFLYLFYKILKLDFYMASILAFFISATNNFILNNLWTFRDIKSEEKNIEKYFRYIYFTSIGTIMQYITALIFFYYFGLFYMLSQIIGILVGFLFNFTMSYLYVWKTKDKD